MDRLRTRQNDENVVIRTKGVAAAAAAAAAVSGAAPRKRTALQTVTNINHNRILSTKASNTASSTAAVKANLQIPTASEANRVSTNTHNTNISQPRHTSFSPGPSNSPNSDDTVEEDDEDDDDYEEEYSRDERGVQRRRTNDDVMKDVDTEDDEGLTTAFAGYLSYDEDANVNNDDDEDQVAEMTDFSHAIELAMSADIAESATNPDALFPSWTSADEIEYRHSYQWVQSRGGFLDESDEDTFDVSMVAEYSDDIFKYMRDIEVRMRPNPGYMDTQTEIHWSMRSILIDWLVQVHHRFNLLPETLFLTVNYIDRFLSLKTVSLTKFQLVGAVALFLAAKYEEINCPSVQEIAYMVDHGYSVDEILKAERYMIDLLNFNLGWPGPMSFLRRTSKADDYELETRTLAKYLLEITIMDERFVGALPSWTAAASHYLARKMLDRGDWTEAHVYFSGYTESQLLPAANVLESCCLKPLEHHKAIYEKYADRKFKKASVFVAEWIDRHREEL